MFLYTFNSHFHPTIIQTLFFTRNCCILSVFVDWNNNTETVDQHQLSQVLEGIVYQFWMNNIFVVSQQKKHFLWKVYLDETTLTQNNGENRVLKVSPTKFCYIYYIYNTEWLWAPFFSIISSQSCFIEMDFIYSKLVNNPFKGRYSLFCSKKELTQKWKWIYYCKVFIQILCYNKRWKSPS